MMKAKPIGLYVHIPFCLRKCNYCDFCSFPDIDRNLYISALVREIYHYKRSDKISVDTVFFGGGTPSLLEPNEFQFIISVMNDVFNILPNAEFTLEMNPKTATREKIEAFVSCGVNRISIGVQSIHENELKTLGRAHNFEDFKKSYDLACKSGISNISVDVMYGIPNQTLKSFKDTLTEIVALQPNHISAYGLILEDGTPFWDMQDVLSLPSEDEECDMYYTAAALLYAHGYNHYEISNYAKAGFESRHNLKYWNCEEYVGVGISAYSYFGGRRYGNTRNIKEYLSEDSIQYISEEVIDDRTQAYEYAMLGLRLRKGISLLEYKKKFKTDFLTDRKEKINTYVLNGYMTKCQDRIALTEKGFYVSNTILTDLL